MRLRRGELALNYIVLAFFALLALTPLVHILLAAVTPAGEARTGFALPDELAWANFAEAWTTGHFGTYMVNSLVVTTGVVVLTSLLAVLAGYAFAFMRFPGRTVLFYVMLLGLVLPAEAFVIPLYYDLRDWGLTDTYWALLLPQTAQSLAFGTFWMRNHFAAYPRSIVEAARLDGVGDRGLLWRILVPSARPALMTMALLIAMWTWNEFLLPLIMTTGDRLRTAPLGLALFQGQHATATALLAAASVIVAAPIVVLYLFLQRRFIEGMLSGATKG
jgi:raffinose/stachyose/melibiose transport system permease protein